MVEIKEPGTGYELSEDYSLLWKLIHEGYRIPAWILYSNEFERPIYDLVEVKFKRCMGYFIGTRGRSYEGFENTEKDFIDNCKSLELKFIKPVWND